ncbi:NmrA family transcriptional regulator, partial [Rhizobium johnstonii]
DELVRASLAAKDDAREVIADADAKYFGTRLAGDELTPGAGAQLSTTSYAEWLAAQPAAQPTQSK